MPSPYILFAMVIQLLPVLYLLIASPAFLLVKLEIPQVARLLRVMFHGYFYALIATGTVGTIAVLLGGHWAAAFAFALVPAAALLWRRWLLGRMDAAIAAGAPAVLRRLHWAGMAANAACLAALLVIVPRVSGPL
ncbi:hypothetical protein [uncultured Alsobacter sp.]|uniref:hypothetical protein n=1 Tax=uncultured Alsobacter sp. TaxID=1748258 RepID=UPI0025CEC9A5|nr:hypothetical protein [uncultured Alsobacter sp.]